MTLLEIQQQMAADVMRPLAPGDRIATRDEDGDLVRQRAAAYVKPNDRLTSVERLEIYNRQYWFRILDCLYDDFPGLRAILGERAFRRLSLAYLRDCPSESFTLRNLGSRLEAWLRSNPGYADDRLDLGLDMVRLEWAHIWAFDGPEDMVLGPEDLLEPGPELRIALQPYVQLLELRYPVDDLRIHVNRNSEEHGVASNAVRAKKHRAVRKISQLKPETIFLAVHRIHFDIYYRRLTPEEFRVLTEFRNGKPLGGAIDSVVEDSALSIDELKQMAEVWFATWAELGWLCRCHENED
ncbi:MAG: HvfC/BufC family peptide modification chaperone [Bryobacteraceae bacterium]